MAEKKMLTLVSIVLILVDIVKKKSWVSKVKKVHATIKKYYLAIM